MFFYFLGLGAVVFFALSESFVPLRVRNAASYGVAACLGLFAGLRSVGVDNDSITYSYVFDLVANSDFLSVLEESSATSQEPGFLIFLKVFYNLGFAYVTAQLFLNLLGSVLLAKFLNRTTTKPMLALLLYYLLFYYFRDFTQTRFFISCVLSLWALHLWFVDSRRGACFLVLMLAVSFHNSALIVLLPIFLSYLELHENYFRLVLVALVAIGLWFIKVTTTILLYVVGLPEQVVRYIDIDDGSGGGLMSIGLGFLISVVLLVRRADKLRPIELLVFYALFSSFVAGLMFADLSILLRMQLLLFTAVIIAPPHLNGWHGKVLLLLILAGALYTNIVNTNTELLRPYQTWALK